MGSNKHNPHAPNEHQHPDDAAVARRVPAHMCRMDHEEIWHNDSENERCPLCRALDELRSLKGDEEDKAEGLHDFAAVVAEVLDRHDEVCPVNHHAVRKEVNEACARFAARSAPAKAGKVLTDAEIDRIWKMMWDADLAVRWEKGRNGAEASPGWFVGEALRYVRDNGYLSPAAPSPDTAVNDQPNEQIINPNKRNPISQQDISNAAKKYASNIYKNDPASTYVSELAYARAVADRIPHDMEVMRILCDIDKYTSEQIGRNDIKKEIQPLIRDLRKILNDLIPIANGL